MPPGVLITDPGRENAMRELEYDIAVNIIKHTNILMLCLIILLPINIICIASKWY